MKQLNFQMIDKKLAKKNYELLELRKTRQKLADKEKEICASIDNLHNQKIEESANKPTENFFKENRNSAVALIGSDVRVC